MRRNNSKYRLIGIGEILWDMLPAGRQLGGAPANFAYHAQALGGSGIIVSAVGDDALGREIIQQLDKLKLTTDYVNTSQSYATGAVTVEVNEDGQPDYTIHENVAWDYLAPSDNLITLAAQASAVCFGSLAQRSPTSRDTIQQFLKQTSPQCLRIFDINLRQSYYDFELIQQLLQLSNVLKLNDEELMTLAELLHFSGSESELLEKIQHTYGINLIALTKGSRGSLLFSGRIRSEHPGFPADVIDTVGAGDAFTAALAIGLVLQYSLEQINEYANRIASYVCTQAGATPALPEDIEMIMQK
jgi:fructokinase